MTLKHTLLLGSVLFVAGITLLQVFVNWGGWPFVGWSNEDHRFRVGFLPVT